MHGCFKLQFKTQTKVLIVYMCLYDIHGKFNMVLIINENMKIKEYCKNFILFIIVMNFQEYFL